MNRIAKIAKSVVAAACTLCFVPAGVIAANAASTDNYVVVAFESDKAPVTVVGNGFSISGVADGSANDADGVNNGIVAIKVPGEGVYNASTNGQTAAVASTTALMGVSHVFGHANTDVETVSRQAPAAVSEAPTPVSATVSTTQNQTRAATVADGKSNTAAATVSAPATAESSATQEEAAQTSTAVKGTDSTAGAETVSLEEIPSAGVVEGQEIQAADFANANVSLIDRFGGAGTLAGVVILGLLGVAGAVSLVRSFILG